MVLAVTGLTTLAAPVLGPAAGTVIGTAVAGSGAVVLEGAGIGATVAALGEGALFAVGLSAGPIGCLMVGCEKSDGHGGYTWDCWKPVVRDASTQPSRGMTLRCLAAHPNVRSVSLDGDELLVGNVFGERFRLAPVSVGGSLALHASVLSE